VTEPQATEPWHPDVPQTARIWNYLLGGKDHFAPDRAAAEAVIAANPAIRANARAGRAALTRMVGYLAGEAGIRQFLDVGTGLPTADNTHEVAQRAAPEAKIVYVDYDPLVLVHARALLVGSPDGVTDYVDSDARDVEKVFAAAAATLDFSQPVALIMSGILGHFEYDEALGLVAQYVARLAPGSFFLVIDGTATSEENKEAQNAWNANANPPYWVRLPNEIERFFEGFELVEPGVVSAPDWRPEPDTVADTVDVYVGLGVKR
jgi:O-methyltransferase involved in polyketide biosynthesis